MSVATQVKRRRGNASGFSTFTGVLAELTFDTDLNTFRAHDGTTPGGYVLIRCNADGSIPLGQFLISADGTTMINVSGQSNMKIKNGQLYVWDPSAATSTPSTPWRTMGCVNGQTVWSAPNAG